jgi:hypothetical protein
MMDYEGTARAQMQGINAGQITAKPMPELGRLKQLAERVSMAAAKVENFNARFHGSHSGAEGDNCDKPVDSYRNDLMAVVTQIERLEAAVSALDSIG